MRHFDAAMIRELLPWPRVEAALETMLRDEVVAPLRTSHAIDVPGEAAASLLMMPAWRVGHRIGVKLVTVCPGNRMRGERAVNAVYALFDARNGTPVALLDGEELTARRTAGASALAARYLARGDSVHLVIAGAGRVAHALAQAYWALRGIRRVSLWSRTPGHADAAAAELGRVGLPVAAVRDLEAAVRGADVVSCATLAVAPLVRGDWLRPGMHLDLVGAYAKSMREADAAAMARADLIAVDTREGALAEGGDIVQAILEGAIGPDAIAASLADLARGRHPGRTRANEITVFKSVGFALEDLAAAEAVLDAAGPA